MESDLLKSAIADAKAVKETALANAKITLEEAFRPHLQKILSTKLQEELNDETTDDQTPENDETESVDIKQPYKNSGEEVNISEDEPKSDENTEVEIVDDEIESEDNPIEVTSEIEDNPESEVESEEEKSKDDLDEILDLQSVINELEADNEAEDNVESNEETSIEENVDNNTEDENQEDTLTLDEILNEMENENTESKDQLSEIEIIDDEKEKKSELDEKCDKLEKENEELKESLNEHESAIKFLKGKINEVNNLNAKLLYTTKIFKAFSLSNDAKMKIVESFDRASGVKEIKLVYTAIAESLKLNESVKANKTTKRIFEGLASKTVGTTKQAKQIISESSVINAETDLSSDIAKRFQKLAKINQELY